MSEGGFDDFDTQIQVEEVYREPESCRLTRFSIFGKPEHTIVDVSRLDEEIREAKYQQYGIVLTNVEDDEPAKWIGPGVDDRR